MADQKNGPPPELEEAAPVRTATHHSHHADNPDDSPLYDLVEQAKAGQIHLALGYASWTAYVADACKIEIKIDRDKRRELVGWLSDEGMSQRAIAATLGVSKNTVTTDLSQIGTPDAEVAGYFTDAGEAAAAMAMAELDDEAFEAVLVEARAEGDMSRETVATKCRNQQMTTGLDGSTFNRSSPRPQKPRRGPLVDDARSITQDMRRITNRINKLLDDDRFDANRKQIGDTVRPHDEWLLKAAGSLHAAITEVVAE
ncbi:helix-turn-helix domain containing protein [Mycobacterium sp. CVI_P3]|uniref:Helix-turn-helix domain containing protein n=1 Tax=Mycobacterium pinniadriaticum TaxID=2994102 RepID=A0ABT3SLY6_9MYCO|nr:helix-turn-helix domain-containing protein [Mycobacterium pinniadriaticum]MCX2934040.1 helix-turn-helix domain containing protein [Mycobacterium pinniadriaticum]MCX2940463.1 helix-turn-helix domain containing protein [Mycobacterium pinniadriaticum]